MKGTAVALLALVVIVLFFAGRLQGPVTPAASSQPAATIVPVSNSIDCSQFADAEARMMCLTTMANRTQAEIDEQRRQTELADARVREAQAAAAIAENQQQRTEWEVEAAKRQAELVTAQTALAQANARQSAAQAEAQEIANALAQADLELANARLGEAQTNGLRQWVTVFLVGGGLGLAAILGVIGGLWLGRRELDRRAEERSREWHQPRVLERLPGGVTIIALGPQFWSLKPGMGFNGQRIEWLTDVVEGESVVLPEVNEKPENEQIWYDIGDRLIDLGLALGSFSRRTITDYRDSKGRGVTRTTYDRMLEWFRMCGIIDEMPDGSVLALTDKGTLMRDLGPPYPDTPPAQKPHQIPVFEPVAPPGMTRDAWDVPPPPTHPSLGVVQ